MSGKELRGIRKMINKTSWKKRLALGLSGGFLMLNTAIVFAAPVELTLEDSIAMALQNNQAIKISDIELQSAEWAIKEAKGGKLFSVNVNHSDKRAKSHSATSLTYGNTFSNTITAKMNLYTGGQVEAGIKKAELGYKVADLGVDESKQQVKLDATTGYFNILQAVNVMKVTQESVEMMAGHLKNVEAQYGVGVVAKSDVLRSEVEVANYQQKMIIAQNNYELAVSKLNNVIGLPLGTELKLKDELKNEKYDLSMEDSIKEAMLHRPEAIQADYSIAIAKESIKVAKGENLPTVSAAASTGWNDTKFPGMENNGWSIGLSADWNAFDSGVTKAKIKQANAAELKAVQTAQQTKDTIQLQVRQAYLNMNEAEKRIPSTQVAVEKAEEDFKISGVRYSAGVGTNIDVLDAQVALTQAKNNYIQAMYDFNTSRANLDKAIGRMTVHN